MINNIKKIEKVHVMFKYNFEIWGRGKCFEVKKIEHNNLIIQDKNRETTAVLDELTKQKPARKTLKSNVF